MKFIIHLNTALLYCVPTEQCFLLLAIRRNSLLQLLHNCSINVYFIKLLLFS